MKVYSLQDAKNRVEPIVPLASLAFSTKKDHFVHLANFHVQLSDGSLLTIPKGLVNDFACIPNILKGFFSFTAFGGLPFFIHDMAYVMKLRKNKLGVKKARLFWDREMLTWCLAMAKSKKDKIIAYLFFYTVRALGSSNFKQSEPIFFNGNPY